MLLERRHLDAIVAVAESGSVTAAAQRLHIVQQALSRTIADAERLTGVAIFTRVARGMQVTAEGRAVVASARAALQAIAQVAQVGRDCACDDAICMGLADCGMAALGQRSALLALRDRGIPVTPVPIPIARHLEALHDGRIDIGFALGFTGPMRARAGPAIEVTPLADEPALGALLPAWHPLAALAEVEPEALSELPLLDWPRALVPEEIDHMLARLGEAGWRGELGPALDDGMVMGQMIALGAGWAHVAPVNDELLPPTVVYRPLTAGGGTPWVVHLLVRHDANARTRLVADVIRDAVGSVQESLDGVAR